jgi:branched-chain amino acid transport system permease protein
MNRLLLLLAIVAVLACPFVITSPYYLHLIVTVAIFAIVTLGLDIVFGYTGEVSIGHAALFGLGAYAAGCAFIHLGLGFWPSLIIGPIVAGAFGFILALPALRVTGPYLAMVTLAFGTIVQILINEMTDLGPWLNHLNLTRGPLGITLTTPVMFDWREWGETIDLFSMSIKRVREMQYFYVVMIFLALTIVVINRILASHLGRAFEALRDSPIASDCMSVSVYRHKVMAFVLSAGFAGLAGVLFAYSEQYIAPNNFSFDLSIQFLLAVTMGGRKSRLGPILGAAIVVYLPNLLADIDLFRDFALLIAIIAVLSGGYVMITRPEQRLRAAVPVVLCLSFYAFSLMLQKITDYKLTVFGLMILFVVYYLPDGIVGFLKKMVEHFKPGLIQSHARIQAVGNIETALTSPGKSEGALLKLDQVTMQFGGLRALDQINLEVKQGTIHGLIGPNGSGKSTMMNVLTGIYTPTQGNIVFVGETINGLNSPGIAARGIARTFQNVQLFGELTLIENVLVGLHHSYRSNVVDVALGSSRIRREESAARARAASILAFVGLAELANEEARNLPYGKQRLLEIGRALALDPKLLLLDEPAAGLTAPDIRELIEIIRKIKAQGITIILIEHHMDVVMSVSDKVSVLDFGQKIAEGKPAEMQTNARVIEAYLGGASASAA